MPTSAEKFYLGSTEVTVEFVEGLNGVVASSPSRRQWLWSLDVLPNGSIITGNQVGNIYRTTTTQLEWNEGTEIDATPVYSIVSANNGTIFAGGWDESYLFVSNDNGLTWEEGYDFDDYEIDSIVRRDDGAIFVGTYQYVWKSVDNGQSWDNFSVGAVEYVMSFAFPGENKIVIGDYDGYIFYSHDGGNEWNSAGTIVSSAWVYALASNGDDIVIACGIGDNHVYRSTDGGITWDSGITLGDATQVSSVAYYDGIFYAGVNKLSAVYRSTDLGETWSLFYFNINKSGAVRNIKFNESGLLIASEDKVHHVPFNHSFILLPPQCDMPPFECNTEINPYCVTDFSTAWNGCLFEEFPLINTKNGINFDFTWNSCSNLTSFSVINTKNGVSFAYTWHSCSSLTSFPELDVSSGVSFAYTWANCTSLTSFPALDFSSGGTFDSTWAYCTNLVDFPAGVFDNCQAVNFSGAWVDCALSQQSVDNILVSLDTAGQSNGYVSLNGGTSSAPGAAGLAAIASLEAKGWTVLSNIP